MIEIINMGVDPKIVKQEKTCHKCETTFSFTNEDINSDSRDGDYVECPLCKAFISAGKSYRIDMKQ